MKTSEIKTDNTELNALIKQAEFMQKKINMDIQFTKNIKFLKNRNKKMHDKFTNFKPKNQKLSVDSNGDISLVNIKSGNPTYPENPISFADKQVNDFIKNPLRLTIGFKKTPIANESTIHPQATNKAISEYDSLNLEKHYDAKNPMGLVLMIGCGLGFQLEKIVKEYDIRNLFLYDKDEDSFYASLYMIDWEEIVNIFDERKGKIRINIGESHTLALTRMRSLPYEIGVYNMTTTYIFMHTNSKDNKLFYDDFIKESSMISSYLGFFDDEQISFSHTMQCINENLPIFVPQKPTEKLPPVFIIGNGPSLDTLVDLIKENIDNVIIISCGTALASLQALEIKPDFHIEMERNYGIAQVLESSTDLDFMKSITLLSLNTVAPAVRSLFKDCYAALKSNDLGAGIYKENMSKELYFELPMCNPTVSNCGMSFAANFGFNEVYLLGTDFGMRNTHEHHSKHSFWSKLEAEKNSDKIGITDHSFSDGRYETAGNFGGKVYTNIILDTSKRNVEIILSENPKIKCHNPNDGALINGAISIKPTNIKIENKKIDRDAIKNKLLEKNFQRINIKKENKKYIHKKYISILEKSKNGLILKEKCRDLTELHSELNRIFNNILSIEKFHTTTSSLIKGSMQIHSGMLTYYCGRAKNKEDFLKCYTIGKNNYNEMIEKIITLMNTNPLKLDDTMVLKDNK